MIKSMTGFGRYETSSEQWTVGWEIRSVNSRFLDLKWRMPPYLRSLETAFEKVVREFASRGRVELFCSVQLARPEDVNLALNRPLAAAMLDQAERLARETGRPFEPDLSRLLIMPNLWQEAMAEPDPALAADAEAALRQALSSWNEARASEGETIRDDLAGRLAELRTFMRGIEKRVPEVLAEKTATLRERIKSMLESLGAEYDEDRMLQETAILTDKLDVSEELSRLSAHLDRLEETVSGHGEAGKRLDFLLQETFREINTCGNKAQDVELSGLVVSFKTELEKCREQVQNVE